MKREGWTWYPLSTAGSIKLCSDAARRQCDKACRCAKYGCLCLPHRDWCDCRRVSVEVEEVKGGVRDAT